MTVKHLDHLNITVSNVNDSADWYGRVFGFEEVESGVYQGAPWKILRSGDALLCMYEHPELKAPGPVAGGVHGIKHFALRIADKDAWLATLAREGVQTHYGSPVAWPNSTAWYVQDPTGYEIEVALWNQDQVQFARV